MKRYTIEELGELNKKNDYHFFSPNTMRFFDSRVMSQIFSPDFETKWYFVTSERYHNYARNDHGERLYTVRVMFADGSTDTIGEFQQYDSREKALRKAELMAMEEME